MANIMVSFLGDARKTQCEEWLINPLRGDGHDVRALFLDKGLQGQELLDAVANVEVLMVSMEKIDSSVLSAAKRLRGVCKYGVGVDNIDLEAAKSSGVQVGNAPSCYGSAVAELALGSMIALKRSLVPADNAMKQGEWLCPLGSEITGSTIGIVGMGYIATTLIKMLQGFRVKILAYDTRPNPLLAEALDYSYTDFDTLIKESDIISLQLPLSQETRHFITLDHFKLMKRNAIFINMARGGLVSEQVLLRALNENYISGAAVDAFEKEPPGVTELVSHPRVIALPHIGASTVEASVSISKRVCENIRHLLSTGSFKYRVC